jgi:DNA modification methylase
MTALDLTEPRHSLNAVCPYFTMFPLSFPFRALKQASPRALVLDPFCGRGTSNYAARYLGLRSYGIDTSPVAVAIAKAKLSDATHDEVMQLARLILAEERDYEVPSGPFWRLAYHSSTLDQICRLRAGLKYRQTEAAALLRGIVLGCLHGPLAKDSARSGYFSNQMPRTFASKPAYSVRYWQAKQLRPPKIDVLNPIERRLTRIAAEDIPKRKHRGVITRGDSTLATSYAQVPDNISYVVTSPPYYGLVTYVQDQWLRNWFVGGPDTIDYGRGKQLSHESPEAFAASLGKVWNHCGDRLKCNGEMVVRFGSIRSRDHAPLEILRESLKSSKHDWRVKRSINVGTADAGKRQADAMGTLSKPTTEFDVTIAFA